MFVGVVNGGIFSALVAHVCLNALSPIGLAGSYRVHTHPTLVPAACVAVLCCGFTVLVLLGHALDCRRTGTIRAAARAFASIHLARSVAAVAAAGCTTLWCMESIEQLAGDGQLDGMLSAFGNNPLLGIGIVVLAAAALLICLRRSAGWLAAMGEVIVRFLVIRLPMTSPSSGSAQQCAPNPPTGFVERFVANPAGLRAPPELLA